MKKIIKWLLIICSVIVALIAIWYFYFFNRYMTLQENDKESIQKSLLPDSEGRGYSDLGKKNIEESLNILRKEASFTEEELDNIKYFTIMYMKYKRKALFAKNREEFVPLFIRYKEMINCYSHALIRVKHIENDTYDKLKFIDNESDLTEEYFTILIETYFSFYDFNTMNDLRNSSLPYEKCLEVKRKRSYE